MRTKRSKGWCHLYVPGKSLGQIAQTVKRVDVGRLAVTENGGSVQANLLACVACGLGQVRVIEMKSHGMT